MAGEGVVVVLVVVVTVVVVMVVVVVLLLLLLVVGKSLQNGTKRVSVTSAKTFFFP